MRVTHNMVVNRFVQDLMGNQRRMFDLRAKASSGLRLEKPSDDPVDVSRVMRFASEQVEIDRSLSNAHEARDWLGATDAALAEAQDALARARELALRAANDTLTPTDRQAIIDEIDVLVEHLVQVANTAYKGRFLFAGTDTLNPPFQQTSPTTVVWSGNTQAIMRRLGPDVTIQVNVSGQPFDQVIATLINARNDIAAGDTATLSTTRLTELDSAIDDILQVRSQVGGRMNRAEWAASRLGELSFQVTDLRSELEDADIARVLVDLRAAEVTLQTTLASAARMFQPSLVHFLG